jgi:hypothetical protein
MPIFVTGLTALERKIARVSMVSAKRARRLRRSGLPLCIVSIASCKFAPFIIIREARPRPLSDALHRTSSVFQFRLIG